MGYWRCCYSGRSGCSADAGRQLQPQPRPAPGHAVGRLSSSAAAAVAVDAVAVAHDAAVVAAAAEVVVAGDAEAKMVQPADIDAGGKRRAGFVSGAW